MWNSYYMQTLVSKDKVEGMELNNEESRWVNLGIQIFFLQLFFNSKIRWK